MSSLRIAPATLVRGADALSDAVPAISALGRRVAWITGDSGSKRVPASLRDDLVADGLTLFDAQHRGPCSDVAVAAARAAAETANADVMVAIGGGRVIDVAKAAADDLDLPFVAIPTSPATCAAVTPLSVMYDPNGRYLSARPTRRAPDVVILDPTLLTGADNRLLAAGMLDALAKVHEVRRTLGTATGTQASASAHAALALCDDLEAVIERHADAALAAGPTRSDARILVAEAAVLTPGLIGGLAGKGAKLAAAHPLHNALTALQGSQNALHGELIGFGILVQIGLTGADEGAVRETAAKFVRWGVACHLEALGCEAAHGPEGRDVAREAVMTRAMSTAFPDVDADALFEAMQRIDRWARDEAETFVPRPS